MNLREKVLEQVRELSRLRLDVDLLAQRLDSLESRVEKLEHLLRLLEDGQ